MAVQTATATFTGSEDTVAVTWPAMAGAFGVAASVIVTDGAGVVAVALDGDPTPTGATVRTVARFSGRVELLIYNK